jgi:DNA helicase HerA-like ATPase
MKINLSRDADFDLDILINTRLLIQANSGGGKSWCIRRLLEQSHGKVQQIVIDLEGEFSTLREKFDYVLAGKDGDTPADPRSASLLARKLLELNVSSIIDLYELDHFNRKRFVKLFLDAIVNAPKELWHPCLIVLDEAHVFCPEKGQSEAMSSVIDLATRGRKRGFCAVLATQRLSKLHKDAAAECNNKLIGRTGLDVDMKRRIGVYFQRSILFSKDFKRRGVFCFWAGNLY